MLDFSNAEKQKAPSNIIPRGTIVPVHLTVRPGGAGDGGWLKVSKSGEVQMLDCEFTVLSGDYQRRKIFQYLTVQNAGETDGQKKATQITASMLRGILESARGIKPTDESEQAAAGRRATSYADFDGLRFWAVVGVEKGGDQYEDKNRLSAAVTPDRKEWTPLEQTGRQASLGPVPAGTSAPKAPQAAPAANRPAWAS